MTRRSFASLLTTACLLLSAVLPAQTAQREASEYQVKAAFLYNFAKFVEWPDTAFTNPEAPMAFCVIGADPFGPSLDDLQGKRVKNRPVSIQRIDAPADAQRCHVLFISSADNHRMAEITAAVKGSPVLVVGDAERFARRGGTIGFLAERNRVAFEINAGAAKGAGLTVSSQLLKLARTVIE